MARLDPEAAALDSFLSGLTGAVEAGLTLPQAVAAAAAPVPGRVGACLRAALELYAAGAPLADALQQRTAALDPGLAAFCRIVRLHQRYGGEVGPLLNQVSEGVRARQRLAGELLAQSAEARWTARLLAALPLLIALYLALLHPALVAPVWALAAGRGGLLGAAALWLAGVVVCRRVQQVPGLGAPSRQTGGRVGCRLYGLICRLQSGARERLLGRIQSWLNRRPRRWVRRLPARWLVRWAATVAAAGRPLGLGAAAWLALGAGLGLTAAAAVLTVGGLQVWWLAAAVGWGTAHLPLLGLGRRARLRRERLQAELASLIEDLWLCTAAGLNLRAALAVVAESGAGAAAGSPLQLEVARAARRLQRGVPLRAALARLAAGSGVSALAVLCQILILADRLGFPVCRILAAQATQARALQGQTLAARVALVPLRLSACAVVFFLPALLILTLLPAALAVLAR